MAEQDSYQIQSTSGSRQGLSTDSCVATGVIWTEALVHVARSKWLLAKVSGSGMLAGILLCLLSSARYTGTVTIMPPRQSQSSAALMMSQLATSSASLAAAGGAGLSLRNPNDIYIGLLSSRPVADAIIREFGLSSVYHAKDMTASRKILAAHTTIKSEKSSFISVTVTDHDKKRVAQNGGPPIIAAQETMFRFLALLYPSPPRPSPSQEIIEAHPFSTNWPYPYIVGNPNTLSPKANQVQKR